MALYQGVELAATGPSGMFFLDVREAQFDNANGYIVLDPAGTPYYYVGTGATLAKVALTSGSATPVAMTNLTAVQAASQGNATFTLCARTESPWPAPPPSSP